MRLPTICPAPSTASSHEKAPAPRTGLKDRIAEVYGRLLLDRSVEAEADTRRTPICSRKDAHHCRKRLQGVRHKPRFRWCSAGDDAEVPDLHEAGHDICRGSGCIMLDQLRQTTSTFLERLEAGRACQRQTPPYAQSVLPVLCQSQVDSCVARQRGHQGPNRFSKAANKVPFPTTSCSGSSRRATT